MFTSCLRRTAISNPAAQVRESFARTAIGRTFAGRFGRFDAAAAQLAINKALATVTADAKSKTRVEAARAAGVRLRWLALAYLLMWGGRQPALGDLEWVVNRGFPTLGALVLLVALVAAALGAGWALRQPRPQGTTSRWTTLAA